ncbi:NADP-reducing hydrogenase subunit HndA [Pseudooceanicola marinus]|uniref:NADP-reducing hydrogenase subunit HndA n=1 Tax=Pseudooceanicola marinus TaxID=396013 RepID=A0A1X6ZGA1_9RHOB|nr:formate dehydrogenase subunit gamma [Pseudooceanicola marinus]PJE28525.1 formate dehydrogenase subunit gamma [Pseudooceanicola marinus]SLN50797.1 NADP-reducing hydrogenase subunit HndA [Pseudooceanicola marinus]
MNPQPRAPQALPEVGEEEIRPLIDRNLHLEGPLLPMLHDIQAAFGHIPETAVPMLAAALNLGRAEVHGVISFYHDFRKAPAGRHVLKICRAEACQSMGGEAMAERLLAQLGLDWHGTSADGRVTVEPVYCLGLCACAPAAMLDETLMGRASEARLMAAVEGAE